MRPLLTVLIAGALWVPRTAGAQDPAPGTWSDTIGCTLPADTIPLMRTMPLEVVNHLQAISNSVFVHAFLIRYIAEPAAGQHRLSKCARAFIDANPLDFATLRKNQPNADAILEALRTAEEARLRTARLADSTSVLTLVDRLREEPTPENLASLGSQLQAVARRCPGGIEACRILMHAIGHMDALRESRSVLEAARDAAEQAAEEIERVGNDVVAATAELGNDMEQLANLQSGDVSRDDAAVAALQARILAWQKELERLTQARENARVTAGLAEEARQRAAETVTAHLGDFRSTLDRLATELRRATDGIGRIQIAAQSGTRVLAAVGNLGAPPTEVVASAASARTANLILELADFIIARARSEAVNAFVVNLYDLVSDEPLLQLGFRDTWALMSGLSKRTDGRLNAVEVGRIPLNAWRATLAGDFVALSVNLLEAGPVGLCRNATGTVQPRRIRSSNAAAAGRGTASAVPDGPSSSPPRPANGGGQVVASSPSTPAPGSTCQERVAVLRPLAPVARRLLEGDPVFAILRDAATLTPPQGPALPADWRRVSQGLSVIASLADAYIAQGYVPSADPTRHPYILTPQSLVQVPQPQRDAFVRLLLVRSVPTAIDRPTTVDEAALRNAAETTTRILERLATRPAPSEMRPAEAGFFIRSTFEALLAAADVARALAPSGSAPQLDTVRARWRAVSGALESVATRDFGMALSRTTVLVQELRGEPLPAPMITLAALASSLTEARTGEQVRQAFETAASPLGGWQAKRYGEGGATITAFPGLALGYEQVIDRNGDPENLDSRTRTLGASMSLGLEWQADFRGADGQPPSSCFIYVCGVGAFIPIVDLGALLSYRLGGSDDVATEPNTKARQVFAPGAYLSLALTRRVPATLLVGAQLMPSLRSVTTSRGVEPRSAIRYGAGIVMDVMLFDF